MNIQTSDPRAVTRRRTPASSARSISTSQMTRPAKSANLPDAPEVHVLVALGAEPERPARAAAAGGWPSTRPPSEPATTTSSAPNSTLTPSRWKRGSRPPTTGARNRPAARNAVAIQNIAVCRCHVRVRLYGRYCPIGKAEERLSFDRVVRRQRAQQHLDDEERDDDAQVLGDGAHRRRDRHGRERIGRGRLHSPARAPRGTPSTTPGRRRRPAAGPR